MEKTLLHFYPFLKIDKLHEFYYYLYLLLIIICYFTNEKLKEYGSKV